jgi:hypothetical protein
VTAERYTVVFTGLLSLKKPGEYPYLSISGDPLASSGSSLRRGRPPYEWMGYEISLEDLPEYCRWLVLNTYRELWGLKDTEGAT